MRRVEKRRRVEKGGGVKVKREEEGRRGIMGGIRNK